MTIDDYKAAANNIRNYGPGPTYSGATATIPVIVHVVKDDDGQASNSSNTITESFADTKLAEISAAYSTNPNYTINFVRCGKINFVHNTTIYNTPLMVTNYAYSPWAINMYIDNSPGNPSATFPWSPGVNNNIYMRRQYSFPFGTTAHELGHNMGLIHTFGYPAAYNVPANPLLYNSQPDHPYNPDGIPRELVIRTPDPSQTYDNPNHYGPGYNNPGDPRGGDLIGDTPADCNPDDQINYPGCAESGCNIAGNYKDYNGMFLNDPNNILGKNIMSYRSCRSEFTNGQLDVVWDTWEDQRMQQFKPLWCGNMDDRVEYKGTSIGLNRVAIEFSQTSLGAGLVAKALTMPNGDFSGMLQPNTTGSFTVTQAKVTKFGSNPDFSYTYDDWRNGVTTYDMVIIRKHILTTDTMDGYDQVAADVNLSNSVTTFDMSLIQQLILGMIQSFPNATQPWRFIRESVTLNHPQDFDGVPNPGGDNPFQYPNLDGSIASYNMLPGRIGFDAVKLGDVNGGATVNGFNGNTPSEGNPILVTIVKQVANGKSSYEFKVDDFEDIAAYQFDIEFPASSLQYSAAESMDLSGVNSEFFGTTRASQGLLKTLWYDEANANAFTLADGSGLFRLRFNGTTGTSLNDVHLAKNIGFRADDTEAPLRNFAYTSDGTRRPLIEREYQRGIVAALSVYPNPFDHSMAISVQATEDGEVELNLFNVTGQSFLRSKQVLTLGANSFEISDLPPMPDGIYFLQVNTGSETILKKLVRKN